MNQNEFVGSLTQEQTIAFNAVLISQRDQLKAMYDMAESDLVVAQAEIRDGFNSERKAAADVAQNAIRERDELISEFGGHPVVQAMKETARIAEKTRRKAELEAELLAMESEE